MQTTGDADRDIMRTQNIDPRKAETQDIQDRPRKNNPHAYGADTLAGDYLRGAGRSPPCPTRVPPAHSQAIIAPVAVPPSPSPEIIAPAVKACGVLPVKRTIVVAYTPGRIIRPRTQAIGAQRPRLNPCAMCISVMPTTEPPTSSPCENKIRRRSRGNVGSRIPKNQMPIQKDERESASCKMPPKTGSAESAKGTPNRPGFGRRRNRPGKPNRPRDHGPKPRYDYRRIRAHKLPREMRKRFWDVRESISRVTRQCGFLYMSLSN